MNDALVKAGQAWTHKIHKQHYRIEAIGIMDCEINGWLPSVTYRSLLSPDRFYTRKLSIFLEKFEPYDYR